MIEQKGYPLTVDYGISLKEGIKAGNYYQVNSNINFWHFPAKRKGIIEVVIEIINLSCYISRDYAIATSDIINLLDKGGYRPAELRELLSFGERDRGIKGDFSIAALGSIWKTWGGDRFAPMLYRRETKKILTIIRIGNRSRDSHCGTNILFAAVKK